MQKHVTSELVDELVDNTEQIGDLPLGVTFQNCSLEPGAMSELFKRMPQLERLHFVLCRFCESEYEEWKSPPPLRELSFDQSYVTDYDLVILKKLDRLESLSFEGVPVTGKGLAWIPQPSLLVRLNLNRTAFGDKEIEVLKRFRKLNFLGLIRTNCSAKAFYLLGIFPELEEVEVDIKPDPHGWFYSLIRQPSLVKLPGTDLLTLDLNDWKIKDESLSTLGRQLPTKVLIISNNKLSDECLLALNHLPQLSELIAEHCNFNGQGFGASKQSLKLRKLVLDDNPITLAGLEAIAKLPSLKYLSLRRTLAFNEIDKFKSFENTSITFLNISSNPITPQDLESISKMADLQTLKLDNIPLRLECFAALALNKQVKYLTFYNSRGLNHAAIIQLSKMKQLCSLHFGGSDISKKDAVWLKKNLPNTNIDLHSLYSQ